MTLQHSTIAWRQRRRGGVRVEGRGKKPRCDWLSSAPDPLSLWQGTGTCVNEGNCAAETGQMQRQMGIRRSVPWGANLPSPIAHCQQGPWMHG